MLLRLRLYGGLHSSFPMCTPWCRVFKVRYCLTSCDVTLTQPSLMLSFGFWGHVPPRTRA